MIYRLRVGPAARADIESALDWYGAIDGRLRRQLVADIDRKLIRVAEAPQQFPLVFHDVRRAVLRRFPYSIYFFLAGDAVAVIALTHNRRDPANWQSRA